MKLLVNSVAFSVSIPARAARMAIASSSHHLIGFFVLLFFAIAGAKVHTFFDMVKKKCELMAS